MKKNRVLYGLLVIVLTVLIVLSGTWIPQALLERKAETLSSGKTAITDNQEVTPYTYTMSVEKKIPKLADFVRTTMDTGLEVGLEVRDPLDTELTRQQAMEKTREYLLKLNEIYLDWGLDPMFPQALDDISFAEDESSSADVQENVAGIAETEATAVDKSLMDPSGETADIMDAYFVVDPAEQQLSFWWIWVLDTYGNTVYVAVDAVTGIPVLTWYRAGKEASLVEYTMAVCEAYAEVYGTEYTFSSPTETEKIKIGYQDHSDYIAFDCEGKYISLEYQYYSYEKSYKYIYDYKYDRPGEVMTWLYER